MTTQPAPPPIRLSAPAPADADQSRQLAGVFTPHGPYHIAGLDPSAPMFRVVGPVASPSGFGDQVVFIAERRDDAVTAAALLNTAYRAGIVAEQSVRAPTRCVPVEITIDAACGLRRTMNGLDTDIPTERHMHLALDRIARQLEEASE